MRVWFVLRLFRLLLSFFFGILFDLSVKRMAAQVRVILLHLQPFWLRLLVALSHVPGDGFALSLGLSTL